MKPIAFALLIVASVAAAHAAGTRCSAPLDVSGLPLLELPATKPGDTFAIMISGDGGWRRIDAKISDALRVAGVPVVGFLAPEYFRVRRTPEESACALERTIRMYQQRWKRNRVVLIGYSRGADVLPFMASRLPAELRADVTEIALLGLERTIDFRYHPSWLPFYHPREIQHPVEPELEKLRGAKILCFYGEKENDSLCRSLDPALARAVPKRGGHHFAGDYSGIADTILQHAR